MRPLLLDARNRNTGITVGNPEGSPHHAGKKAVRPFGQAFTADDREERAPDLRVEERTVPLAQGIEE